MVDITIDQLALLTLSVRLFFYSFENLVCTYSQKIRKKMDSLPAWWTFLGYPDFRKQTFYFAWPRYNPFSDCLVLCLVDYFSSRLC